MMSRLPNPSLRLVLQGLLLTCLVVADLPIISVKGTKFYTADGDQWFVKGIAYQLTPDDPLVDNAQCRRDATLMKTLGANAIRVYHVDASKNHDACMQTFDDAGIYLFLDLDTFDTQINQDKPQWNQTQLRRFTEVLDTFQVYDNLAGVFVGNEVLTTGDGSLAAPYVKAAVRDVKDYRDAQGYRKIPVGYSAADIASLRPMLQNYLSCGNDEMMRVDFFSLNAYEWCGSGVDYKTSGYISLDHMVDNYNVPIFFSETGCNQSPPRTFDDQAAIFGDEMSKRWSGAIIYEWIEEANNYGLITYGPPTDPGGSDPNVLDGFTRSGQPTPVTPDFPNLSSQWAAISPKSTPAESYDGVVTPPPCPKYTEGVWLVNGDVPLPSLGQPLNQELKHSITAGISATDDSQTTSSTDAARVMTPPGRHAGAGAGLVGAILGGLVML